VPATRDQFCGRLGQQVAVDDGAEADAWRGGENVVCVELAEVVGAFGDELAGEGYPRLLDRHEILELARGC
jgi:hypothetical protein